MVEIENVERPYPRPPSGAKVGHLPSALVPARTALVGRYVTLEPLDAQKRTKFTREREGARPHCAAVCAHTRR
jgi:hypothetical protein